MESLPTTCSCKGGDGSEFLPMLVVVVVFLAAQVLWNWFEKKYAKGNRTMKNVKSLVIVVALVAAVAVAVAVKQSKRAPKAEVATVPAAAPVQELPRLVDLGATKCIPCKMMAPILEDLKTTYTGKLNVEFIDVWENPEPGQKYGIRVIPTQIFFAADGKELFRHEGFFSKDDILTKWKEFGVELTAGTLQ